MTVPTYVNPEEAVVSLIKADTNINSLISDRILPLDLPKGSTLPTLTYQRISTFPKTKIHGRRGLFPKVRIQITVWEDSYTDAKRLVDLLDHKFDGYSGEVIVGTRPFHFASCFTEDGTEDSDLELGLFSATIDLIITYLEE